MDRTEIFERYSVPKAVLTLAVPTVLGMLVTVIYNMADTYFVGQTHDPNMVAAVSLCLPFFYFLMSVGNLFGIGGGTYISRLMGQKRTEEAKNVSAFCFYTCLAVGVVCIIVFLWRMQDVLMVCGASANTHDYAEDYLVVMTIGSPAVMLQYTLGQQIRAEGAAKYSMIGMILGTVVNIVLDPIMISVLGWNALGASIATVIGNIVSTLYYLWYLFRKNTVLSVAIRYFKPTKEIVLSVLKVGIPSAVNTILICVGQAVLNNYAKMYSDLTVAAVGIAFRIAQTARLILIGLSQGTQPFVGYHYGAKRYKRMNQALRFTIGVGIGFGCLSCLAMLLVPEPLVRFFIDTPEVISQGAEYLRMFASTLPVLILLFAFMHTFQALGKGIQAMVLAIFRDGVAFIPSIMMFNAWLGREGIVLCQPFSDVLSIIVALVLYLFVYGKLKRQEQEQEMLAQSEMMA